MAFKFKCPECGTSLLAADNSVGREMHCPSCQATFDVPEPSSQPPSRATERRSSEDDDEEADRRRRRRAERESDYDYEPEPRRRRRRPSGRSPLFIIGVIFGVLILGSCTCCGGGYMLLPGEKWRNYQSPQGGYSVEIPVEPNKNMQAMMGVKPEPGVTVEGGILWKRGECYAVTYADTDPKHLRGRSDDEILRDMVREMTNDPEVIRVSRDVPITVSGFPGREVEFLTDDGGTNLARLVVTDRRVYIVIGGGRFVKPGNQNVRRFLDSFKVTAANPGPNLAPPTRWK